MSHCRHDIGRVCASAENSRRSSIILVHPPGNPNQRLQLVIARRLDPVARVVAGDDLVYDNSLEAHFDGAPDNAGTIDTATEQDEDWGRHSRSTLATR